MSKGFLLVLMGFGLITVGLHSRRSAEAVVVPRIQPPATAAKDAKATPTVFACAVEGKWKSNLYDAQQDALKEAQAEVMAYLRSQEPPVYWEPPLSYISRLARTPWKEESKEIRDADGISAGWVYQVRLQVEVTPSDRAYLLDKGREVRMVNRMLGAGKVLAALVLVFAAFAGFLRLDEQTKGFYTGWLKVAAVGLVAAAVVGLYLWA